MRHFIYLLTLVVLAPLSLQAQVADSLEGRQNILQQCISVQSPEVQISLLDAGVEDNDTVSLLLNGKWVLQQIRLAKAKQSFNFTLMPGDNELALYANNLGDIPNNTAAMSINGGKQISLQSGLKTNGTMRLRYAAPGMAFTAVQCETTEPDDDKEAATIRSNPSMAFASYNLVQTGIRLNAQDVARAVDIQDCYNSNESKVELLVWDCGVEDNDTISLYVNGQWVLRNFRLTKAKHAVKVTLDPGENMVLMYAHNLGDIPKNTAALSVKGSFSTNEVGTMISDENTCGAIRLNYGLQDAFGRSISPCLNENTIDSTSTPEMVYMRSLQKPKVNTSPATAPSRPTTQPNPPSNRPVIVIPPPSIPSTRPAPAPAPRPAPAPQPRTRKPGQTPDRPGPGRNDPPKPQH